MLTDKERLDNLLEHAERVREGAEALHDSLADLAEAYKEDGGRNYHGCGLWEYVEANVDESAIEDIRGGAADIEDTTKEETR